MTSSSPEPKSRFSQPIRQIIAMVIVLGLVAAGGYVVHNTVEGIFWTNPYLNGLIGAVFLLGIITSFRQVFALMGAINWIESFARLPQGVISNAPSMLAPLAALLKSSRSAQLHLSPSSSKTILETVGQRIDEDREFTRYLSNTLIFLGLLGTFYGLATTVPALVETIQSLNPREGETGTEVFGRLQAGLETQLGGMGTAFSSSLLGLFGSLIIGLLELFAGRGQNRFYNELEEWLSGFTRVTYAGAAGSEDEGTSGSVMALMLSRLSDSLGQMQAQIAEQNAQNHAVIAAVSSLAQKIESQSSDGALARLASSQEHLITLLSAKEGLGDAFDPESRQRLRSIDTQLLRLFDEISTGRQDSIAELRGDLAHLTRTLRDVAGPSV